MAIKFLNTVAVDTDVLYVDASSNNVGIGTTSPHFYNNYRHLTINGTSGAGFMLKNGGSNKYEQYVDGGGAVFYLFDNDPLKFYTSGIERLRVTGTGNVGIGTTNPLYPLQVAGNAYINNGTLFIDSGRRIKWGNSNQWIEGTNDTSLEFSGGGGGTQMILTSTGNVGIGTTSPSRKLEVDFTSTVYGAKFTRSDAAGSSLIEFANSAGVKSIIGYDAGVDGYKIRTASATNLVVKQNGNVGIGTTSPLRKLSVLSSSIVSSEFKGSSTGHLIDISNSNASPTYNGIRFQHNNTFKMGVTHIADGTTKGYIQIGNGYATGSEILVVDGRTSNVGIGTTSPAKKLDVNGSTNIDGTLFVNATNNHIRLIDSDGTGNFSVGVNTNFQIRDITANTTPLTIKAGTPSNTIVTTSSGNVGIGTGSPSELLHIHSGDSGGTANIAADEILVEGDGDTGITISSPSSNVGTLAFGDENVSLRGALRYDHSDDSMIFRVSSAEKMRITDTGNVGIGTTSPSAKLQISTTMTSSPTSNIFLDVDGTNTTGGGGSIIFGTSASAGSTTSYNAKITGIRVAGGNGGDSQLGFWTTLVSDSVNPQERMTITKEGNVGIGTTSLSQKLEVAGNVKLDGDNRHIYFGGNNTFIGERSNSTELELRGGGNSSAQTVYIDNTGNLGIGTSNPVQKLHVTGNARVTGAYYDSNNLPGTSGQVLSSTATGTDWVSLSEISGVDGTGTTNYVAKWSDSDTITDSVIYDDGTNVGIGTTSPQSKLQINGGYGLTVTASDGAYTDGYFGRIQSDYGTNALRIVSRSGDVFRATNYGQDVAILTGTPAAGTSERIRITSSGNVGINKTAPAAKFHVNGSTIITLPSTGNYFKIEGDVDNNLFYAKNDSIGIGTTSPTRKLTVNGSADVFDSLLINSNTPATDATTNAELVIQAKGNQAGTIRSSQWYFQTIPDSIYGNSAFRIAKNYDGGSTSEYLRILSNGNVGIGTTSPDRLFEVYGAIDGYIKVDGGRSGNHGFTLGSDVYGFIIWDDTSGDYRFVVDQDTGNVGIGTTDPQSKLQVDGGIQMADDTDAASADKVGTLRYRTSGNNSYVDMCMQTGATTYEWVNIVQNNW